MDNQWTDIGGAASNLMACRFAGIGNNVGRRRYYGSISNRRFNITHCIPYLGGTCMVAGLTLALLGTTDSFQSDTGNTAAKLGGLILLFATAFWMGLSCACLPRKSEAKAKTDVLSEEQAVRSSSWDGSSIQSSCTASGSKECTEWCHSVGDAINCSLCGCDVHQETVGAADTEITSCLSRLQSQFPDQVMYYCQGCVPKIHSFHANTRRCGRSSEDGRPTGLSTRIMQSLGNVRKKLASFHTETTSISAYDASDTTASTDPPTVISTVSMELNSLEKIRNLYPAANTVG